ncbi:uncharacterized protein LOC114310137 [Camellia sinensis]|uniref:uncharacterized protein LOC114310137 n=1 Tax=Camellia sinensis TaxID=4442 RepID=UPI0010368988|nr:uncharacterized protein LOC114310137 [Camellia sinensis]
MTVFGDVDSKLQEAKTELHSLDLQSDLRELDKVEKGRKKEVRCVIWKFRKRIEWMWVQKSRMDWAFKGDRNTRFFHIIATKRHNRNLIASLEVNGVEVKEPNEVKHAACYHFQSLFTKQWRYRPRIGGELQKIGANQVVDILEREFSVEEVWAAIKDCDGNKAPSPDGFNMLFFKKA